MPWVIWYASCSMRVEADERADNGADGLTAERWRAVDDDDLATELRGLQRRRDPRDPCAEHADIGHHGPDIAPVRATDCAGGDQLIRHRRLGFRRSRSRRPSCHGRGPPCGLVADRFRGLH